MSCEEFLESETTQNRRKMQSAVKYYYNINKILMSKLGMWPKQHIFFKIFFPTLVSTLVVSVGFLELVRLLEIWRRLTDDCESFIIVLLAIGAHIKMLLIVLKNKNIEQMLTLIDYHWRVFTHSLEVQIMHEYAIIGRKITISYSVIIYSLMTLYMMIPLVPQLMDLIIPLNESRPYVYLFDVDYSFDRDEYYYSVLLHSYVTIVSAVTTMVITDTSYMSLAHHVCGLFAAIGYRLENLTSEMSTKKDRCVEDKCKSTNDDDRIYRELTVLLRKHQLSLEYFDLLESLFALYSFSMILLHFVVMSLLGIQIITFLKHKGELIRYVAMVIGGFVHLLVLSYPGQEIMDHSGDIFDKAYNMLWYRTSRRTTQLLSILLYRSLVPCTLTAGKLYVLSFQNYASVMQGTLSYFTALSSFK